MFADVESVKAPKVDKTDWPVTERLSHRIIDGDRNGLVDDLDEARSEGLAPLDIINDHLLAGMKVVGERFASGEMQLPFVLQSAETMKAAVAHLEQFMTKADGESSKGRIVLATVKGDVHDIGKNLVDIILTNNGYEVHNLGIKIGIADMIESAKAVDAHAIGMSGLLVKSTLIMRDNLEELNSRELSDIPVLLGGAALTRSYVERDLREVYDGRLFYGRDAFEGLRTMDRLGAVRRGEEPDDPDWGKVPSDSTVPARARALAAERAGDDEPAEVPDRSPEVVDRQRAVHATVLGLEGRQGHRPRRDRRLRERDRAVPQPVAVPTRDARRRGRRRPTPSSRTGSARSSASSSRRLGPTTSCIRRSSTATSRPTPTATTWSSGPIPIEAASCAGSLPPPERAPVPVHRRLLPPGELRPDRRGCVPHRDHGRGRVGAHRQAVRRRTATRSTCSSTASAWRWLRHSPSCGTAASAKSSASPTRTAPMWPACSARSTAAVATRSATPPAPTWRTTSRWPSCSTPADSASR